MTTSDEKDTKAPLKLSRPGKLELKKTVQSGQVRQSFSHGRSKQVTVEVKRSRTFERGASGRMKEVVLPLSVEETAPAPVTAGVAEPVGALVTDKSNLSAEERASRMRALETAKEEDAKRRIREAEEAEIREREAQRLAEEEARRKAEEEAVAELEAANRSPAEVAAAAAVEVEAPAMPVEVPLATPAIREETTPEDFGGRVKRKTPAPKPATTRKDADRRRRSGKLTISQALEGREGRERSLASAKRRREKQLRALQGQQQHQPPLKVVREVVVPETITVQELANRMATRGVDVVKSLMQMGVMVTNNQSIDADTAELVVQEFGHRIKRVAASDVELSLRGPDDAPEDLQSRPPVVTIMGHVDHGKTSLLDALRETDVASGEAGGITQHIGAYQVRLGGGEKITFIDTPGHAAFTEMRARGANVTDLVVLVVAGDDGIKEQTVEAINHAKSAAVPIIVAINKMDRPEANADRVKQELLQQELVVEDLGGDILAVEVSAKEKQGLDKLEEAILLQAELLELKANPDRPAEGVVVEAKLERGRGSVATVLVQRGTLRVGDIFVAGSEWGRVRALYSERGESIDEALPAMPAEILGLNGTPLAGDDLAVVESEAKARDITDFRHNSKRETVFAGAARGSLEQMFTRIKEGVASELSIIIKSDVQGSVEAISTNLEKLGTDEVKVRILHAGVGAINESDITLARATDATIIAFNVRANPQAREQARQDKIEIRYYSIIYDVVDEIKAALSGMLSPTRKENFLGYAEIREVFANSKVGKVAGCMITEGIVKRGAKVRLLRDSVVIHDGTLKTLRRFKDEVREVRDGYECGMAFENYTDIKVGDQIECYEVEEVARQL